MQKELRVLAEPESPALTKLADTEFTTGHAVGSSYSLSPCLELLRAETGSATSPTLPWSPPAAVECVKLGL